MVNLIICFSFFEVVLKLGHTSIILVVKLTHVNVGTNTNQAKAFCHGVCN
uniref:Uncharacterized protein n=1 Tax=uncultured marine virus TaxID=186617 RepID=A0A0F7L3Y9_9VIRU|nr:hypothetical protein [uncultured marine virus]